MKIAIRYYTKTGNTEKLAKAIAEELGLTALTVDEPLQEQTDLLFLCNSVYWMGAEKCVVEYVKQNADKIGTLVNVSSAGLIESSYEQMKKVAEAAGVHISEKEFHCPGRFTAVHMGRPDENDLKAARQLAREVVR